MNRKQIDTFEALQAQVQSLYDEMQTLVKKSPNDGVNKFKLGLINSVLTNTNTFLGEARRPFSDFEVFDEDDIATNSDVMVILSQYLASLEKLRADNIDVGLRGQWYWVIDKKMSDVRTASPKKLD